MDPVYIERSAISQFLSKTIYHQKMNDYTVGLGEDVREINVKRRPINNFLEPSLTLIEEEIDG